MLTQQVRQGDVLIVRAEIPAGTRRRRGWTIAEGEATGHAHVLEAAPVEGATAELRALGERLFARILGGDARVMHPEHGPVVLPPGDYEIVRQREYVPPPIDSPTRRPTTRRVRD